MNYKWLMVISITLMVLSLAAVSASEFDQTTLHDSYFDDDLVVDDLGTDSYSGESLNIDDNMPVSPSEISIDDDVDGSSAEAADGSAEDMDDAAEADEDSSADDDENDDSGDSDITDGDSIIRNMTNDTPNSNFNNEPISNIDGPGSFSELQSLIDQVPEGTVLYLGRDYMSVFSSQLIINKNIVIDGQGHTIDCLGTGRAIYSTSGNVVLRNIDFINGHYENPESADLSNGGAIWIGGTATYTIERCAFLYNWAKGSGGAIYNDAQNMLTIKRCIFRYNTAEKNVGGAISSAGSIYVESSIIENNHAGSTGGAVQTGKLGDDAMLSKIINCIISSNNAVNEGGAVVCTHNLFIDSSTFDSNSATKHGGAVYCYLKIIAQDSRFTSNSGLGYGGAMFCSKDMSVTNCIFISNKADEYDLWVSDGGAIATNYGDMYINNCTFDSNWADNYGGAVFSGGNLYVNYFQADNEAYNTFFNGNIADDQMGGAIDCRGSSYIKNAMFTSNKAYDEGGAIFTWGESHITHCLFDSNRCEGSPTYCQGGAIYSKGIIFVLDSIFNNNYAEDDGGAIYGESKVNIDGCRFDSNSAGDNGGAIYAFSVMINEMGSAQSAFVNNRALDDDGGAIYGIVFVSVRYAVFNSNSALVDGGAIFSEDQANVFSSIFDSNRAVGAKVAKCYGGAIRANSTHVFNTVFRNNYAENHGGAIFTTYFSSSVDYCTFYNNTAEEDGGAVYIAANKPDMIYTFEACQIIANHAGDEGGAIYVDNLNSHIGLRYNIFIANTAKDGHVVFNKGYYKVINNNWWGDIVPSKDNGLLVEWHMFLPNENHVDSDPLTLVMSLDKTVVSLGEKVRANAYFINSNGVKFTGEIPVGDLNIFTQGFKIVGKGNSSNHVWVDFVADKAGLYCIYANLHGQIYPAVLYVLDSNNLGISKDLKISNVNANANSNIVKNAMANMHSSNGPNIFAYGNDGSKTISADLSMGAVEGQFVGASIINQGLFHPIVKSFDVPQSNGDFDIFAVLMSILSIFGL